MGRVIGIDLGTTNSCVAHVVDGKPEIIRSEHDEPVVPSYVAIKQSGTTYVGTPARRDSIEDPQGVVYAVKRLMGRAFDSLEVSKVAETVSYQIVRGPNQDAQVQVGDVMMSPVDVSAKILTYLRDMASDRIGEPVTDAVITVPAHFNDRQRKDTKEAGERAGLTVLRLINEPTAAALSFGFGKEVDKRVAVYDLGGGTFDVSILDIAEGVYEVLATSGDTFLGGTDFDNRLVSYLIREHIMKQTQQVIDKVSMLRLRHAAENAKIELSSKSSTELVLRSFLDIEEFKAVVTRAELEQVTKDLIDRTIQVCERTLADAKLKPNDIEEVILVGGQTRMPAVRTAVEEFFGQIPHTEINPDEAVALGAALHAESLAIGSTSTLLLDVTPLTLGIASYGDTFAPVLEKNTKVPCSVTRTFSTVRDNQESVKIVVLQGEHTRATENVLLGEFLLTGIEKAPRLKPKIDVTFRLDASGILQVTAADQNTGESKEIQIRGFIEGGEPAGDDAALDDQHAPAVKGNPPPS